jgi:hypothetical protein
VRIGFMGTTSGFTIGAGLGIYNRLLFMLYLSSVDHIA